MTLEIIKLPKKGFTLIELLVVITILGVLASAIVIAINPGKRSAQARATIVQTDFKSMHSIIDQERVLRQTPLRYITNSGCSECASCRPDGTDVRNAACVNAMNTAWQRVIGKNIPKDPWGNPYTIDENEAELGCTPDTILSAGSDHLRGGSDDVGYSVPPAFC